MNWFTSTKLAQEEEEFLQDCNDIKDIFETKNIYDDFLDNIPKNYYFLCQLNNQNWIVVNKKGSIIVNSEKFREHTIALSFFRLRLAYDI